jgi:hypothetical protein
MTSQNLIVFKFVVCKKGDFFFFINLDFGFQLADKLTMHSVPLLLMMTSHVCNILNTIYIHSEP